MAERVPALITAVLTEGNFDNGEEAVLRWLNGAHRLMVVRSTCFRKRVEIGLTVQGQSSYPLPSEITQVREVLVNGIIWGQGRHSDIAASQQNWLWITGTHSVTTQDSDAEGNDQIALVPTPVESGDVVEAYAVCRPPDLSKTDDSTLKTPPEFDEALIAGAIATGLSRTAMRPELARNFQQTFEAGCTELLRDVRKRFRGSGQTQARVSGYNF